METMVPALETQEHSKDGDKGAHYRSGFSEIKVFFWEIARRTRLACGWQRAEAAGTAIAKLNGGAWESPDYNQS